MPTNTDAGAVGEMKLDLSPRVSNVPFAKVQVMKGSLSANGFEQLKNLMASRELKYSS